MPRIKSLLELPLRRRQRELASSRAPMARQTFIDLTASTDVGRAAAAMLWDKLSSLKVCEEFTPYPSDDLLSTFGVAEEDLDVDVITDIAKSLSRSVPDQATVEIFRAVATPAHVVRLIEATPAAVGESVSTVTRT